MLKKVFDINGENVEFSELTVGQFRKFQKLSKTDDTEAGILAVTMASGRSSDWVDDNVTLSDVIKIVNWIGDPMSTDIEDEKEN